MATIPQRSAIANFLFGKVSTPNVSPDQYYIGLSTGSVASDGTIIGEVTGGGYSRVVMVNDKTTFSTASNSGAITNLIDISFPQSTTSWGNVTTVFISPNATGGSAIYSYSLPVPKNIQDNVTVLFRGDASGVNGDIIFEVI